MIRVYVPNEKPLIIAGFAGIGKTTVAKKYNNVRDLESTAYEWDNTRYCHKSMEQIKGLERITNPLWPQNYIHEIRAKMLDYDVLLVKSGPDILDVYDAEGIPYVICYPCKDDLAVYRQRYILRGNSVEYAEQMIESYHWKVQNWNERPNPKIVLGCGEMLETYLLKSGYVSCANVKKGEIV